jgi:hypothetical protein
MAYKAGGVQPTNLDAYGKQPSIYPTFYPLLYSFENSQPLLKFGLSTSWQPNPAWEQGGWSSAFSLTSLRVVQQLGGWILTTMIVAAVGGLIRKE